MENKLGWPIIGGHMIECFDNTLYGFFAVMLAPLFFPNTDSSIAEISSFGAFAAGYIARPIGAFIFGLIGDRKGRKTPLVTAMMLVGIPTFLIGCLPSYDSIGIAAPILLVFFRLLQGVFYGAEFPGVNIYIYESFSKETIGQKTGVLIASGVFGAVLAAIVGAFVTMQSMPSWSWRIPFFLGGLAAFYVTFIRREIIESADFNKEKSKNQKNHHPWVQLFIEHKQKALIAIIITGFTVVPLYLTTFFGNQLFKSLGYTTSESLLLNMITMAANGIAILYAGKLADKIGFYRQMLWGSALVFISAIPAFYAISHQPSIISIFFFICSITLTGAIVNGCAMPYVSSFFPVSCRYTAVAATWTIGMALIGGNTPLFARYLVQIYDTPIAPAYWLMFISGTTFSLVYLLKPSKIYKAKLEEI